MYPGEREPEQDDPRRRRQFTLLPGEAREPSPHEPPKLSLVVNADRRLYEAVDLGDLRRAAAWLERGADPNVRDPRNGRTALMEAIAPFQDPALAELLVDKGADVRLRDREGRTALHHAARHGKEEHLRVLLDSGRADIDARDLAGKTPLHLTADSGRIQADSGRIQAAAILVGRGADVGLRDDDRRTPLDCVWRSIAEGYLSEDHREPLERLLSGFLTARIVEARPDSLVVQVEALHSKFTDADRHATERKSLVVPCGVFHTPPRSGDLVRCDKGLTPALGEAWREARRRLELGIERERGRWSLRKMGAFPAKNAEDSRNV